MFSIVSWLFLLVMRPEIMTLLGFLCSTACCLILSQFSFMEVSSANSCIPLSTCAPLLNMLSWRTSSSCAVLTSFILDLSILMINSSFSKTI